MTDRENVSAIEKRERVRQLLGEKKLREMNTEERALIAEAAMAWVHSVASHERKPGFDPVEVALAIVRDVAEIPDRTSPDDQPEMMLVKDSELRRIVHDRLMEAFSVAPTERKPASSSEIPNNSFDRVLVVDDDMGIGRAAVALAAMEAAKSVPLQESWEDNGQHERNFAAPSTQAFTDEQINACLIDLDIDCNRIPGSLDLHKAEQVIRDLLASTSATALKGKP